MIKIIISKIFVFSSILFMISNISYSEASRFAKETRQLQYSNDTVDQCGKEKNETNSVSPEAPKTEIKESKLSFYLGVDLLSGNTNSLKFKMGTDSSMYLIDKGKDEEGKRFTMGKFTIAADYTFRLEDKTTIKENKLYSDIAFHYYPDKHLTYFVFIRPSFNEIQKLQFRYEGGIGLKYNLFENYSDEDNKLFPTYKNELSLSMAAMMDIYQYSEKELGITDEMKESMNETELSKLSDDVFRLSLRFKWLWEFMDGLEIRTEFYYQPTFQGLWKNVRLLLLSTLNIPVSKTLSYEVMLRGEFYNFAPAGINPWDWTFSGNLKITF